MSDGVHELRARYRLLVVDDEADIRSLLLYNLEKAGFEARAVGDGRAALEVASAFRPHLILLDVMMPRMNGWEVCRQLRARALKPRPQIIFLTAKSEEESEVKGFDIGGDEYLVKPIKPRTLIRRIQHLLNKDHTQKEVSPIVQTKDLYMNPDTYELRYKGKPLRLRKREFELLYFLAHHSGQIFDRASLMRQLWGEDVYVSLRTIDVHIRRIRQHIGDGALRTVSGRGYMFQQ